MTANDWVIPFACLTIWLLVTYVLSFTLRLCKGFFSVNRYRIYPYPATVNEKRIACGLKEQSCLLGPLRKKSKRKNKRIKAERNKKKNLNKEALKGMHLLLSFE